MCWKMLRTNLSNGTKGMNNPFFHGEVFAFPIKCISETLMHTLSKKLDQMISSRGRYALQ